MSPRESSYDVVVVGARCAGASTAMLLAREGARVLLVDKGRYGSDTLSTLAIMRGGVLQLGRWGIVPRLVDAGTPAIRTTSFFYGDEEIALPIEPRDGVDALYAPRRSVLDRALVDAAGQAGADIAFSHRLENLVWDTGRVAGVVIASEDGTEKTIRADLVIGADGRHSAVARLVGAKTYRQAVSTTASVYGFWSDIEASGFEWFFRPGVSAGSVPTNDGLTLVFASMPPSRFAEEGRVDVRGTFRVVITEAAPVLARRLDRARQVGTFHGFPGFHGYFRESIGPGWALVGDAGYFKDPLTAHGITDALRDAELLARACRRGTSVSALSAYPITRDRLSSRLFDITGRIASFEWDLDSIKELHLALSREMNKEVRAMAEKAVAA